MKQVIHFHLWIIVLTLVLAPLFNGTVWGAGPESAREVKNTTYFFDDFESGLGNWIVSGQDWDLTTSEYRSPTHSLTDSPLGNFGSNWNASATQSTPMDLSSATSPVLTFWHKHDVPDYGDYLIVEISTDGGVTWPDLADWHDSERSTWSMIQIDLNDYRSSQVRIRFRISSDSDDNRGDGWYIDDVWVKEKDTVRLSFPFSDEFESGLGNWIVSGYNWDTTEAEYRSGSSSLTDSPSGNFVSNTYVSAILIHPIDLSVTSRPVLTFWHKHDVPDYGDYLRVEISTDGGTTWPDDLAYWHDSERSTWSMIQIELGDYRSSEVKIRFRLYSDSDDNRGDGWYIDDVEIKEKDTEELPYPFSDTFESGLENWIVSGYDWDTTEMEYCNGTHSLTDSPSGNFISNTYASATLAHPIDLRNSTTPVLIFWHKLDMPDYGDYARVEISTDGGSTWPDDLVYWHDTQQSTWSMVQIDLGEYRSFSEVKIRFRLYSDSDNSRGDGWYIDDVEIKEKDTENLSLSFSELFEGGLDNWIVSGQDWGLTELEYRSGSHSLSDSPSGNYISNTYASATLAHPVSTYDTTYVLYFWHKFDLPDYGDYAILEVSTDGGSTWPYDLDYWHNDSQTTWSLEGPYFLTDYQSTQFKIRFKLDADSDSNTGDGWYIDDVIIKKAGASGIEDEVAHTMPKAYTLHQNYPNPFNPSTTIEFEIPGDSQGSQPVNLAVYDIRGRLVKTLADSEFEPGKYRVHWNGRNDSGEKVSSGIYLYTLTTGDKTFTRKMTLSK